MADTYQVTKQVPSSDIDGSGNVENGVRITFATKPHNVVGELFVPNTQYTAESVRPLLEAAAEKIEQVHAL